ncbi:MAG: electron transfer flavoprotein subunit alpha/FixB family protein [Saprospiraceae bacterium]|nr:electron transfer flavoprotein subunit alpha/FixB family protein [Saprospiraceae bacterium]
MSVLVYIESPKGHIKKTGYEVATYGAKLAASLGTDAIALIIGYSSEASDLSKYGITKVIHVNSTQDDAFDAQTYSHIIASVAKEQNAKVVILSHSANGKGLTGRLAIKLDAGSVSGANALPDLTNGFGVTKSVYSGKAIVKYNIQTEIKVISVMGNSIQPELNETTANVQQVSITAPTTKLKVVERKTSEGIVPLPEAELVVSAGRGMKGPENWGIIEALAKSLGATTACSRPVADADWRPHHEHVGQTGVAIRPNLYIAAGISGAIQHLAGVNNSKVIVVINKDPEAPFFKAADYGVVGDLFEVVPKLTAAIDKFKNS